MAAIIKSYREDAAQVAIDETINFAEKLAPFINPATDLQKETIYCLIEVCNIDPYNCHVLNNFLTQYGDIPIRWDYGLTTINREMKQFTELLSMA